jgi:hypothetical protein
MEKQETISLHKWSENNINVKYFKKIRIKGNTSKKAFSE